MFALFAGDTYYPMGGWEDFQGVFDTVDAALAHYHDASSSWDWYHVVNMETREIVSANR